MKRLISIVQNHPRLSIAAAILLTSATMGLMASSARCLRTPESPYGIISLELAWNQKDANHIRSAWNERLCDQQNTSVSVMARTNIWLDMLFLIAYTILFCALVILKDPSRSLSDPLQKSTAVMLSVALAAGMLDVIENLFILLFLSSEGVPSFLFAFPASLKFVFVILTIAYLARHYIRKLMSRRIEP